MCFLCVGIVSGALDDGRQRQAILHSTRRISLASGIPGGFNSKLGIIPQPEMRTQLCSYAFYAG